MDSGIIQLWEVIGGSASGGLLVRERSDLASAQVHPRLATGALVEQIQLQGDRLCYRMLTGQGPYKGWVSVKLRDRNLVVRFRQLENRASISRLTAGGDAAEVCEAFSVPRAIAILERGMKDGLHYGAQLSVVYRGHHLDFSVGEAAPGTPMSKEHVLCWSSSVKPLMCIALGKLEEQGKLRFQDAVAKYLPEFGTKGKESTTIAHCLLHMAGLWNAAKGVTGSPQEVASQLCRQAPAWTPGTKCGYDSPAWFVLGEVVRAADPARRPYEQFVEEDIFAPLGLKASSIGIPDDRYRHLSDEGRLASIYMAPMTGNVAWKVIPGEDDPIVIKFANPAGNGRGPAHELAAVYASLLPGSERRVIGRDAASRITAVAREGVLDELQGTDTAWSLGFAMKSILCGRHASQRAFGHGGSQSSWAFADPEHDLAVACLCNGKPGTEAHYRRVGNVSTAIFEDLGLASPAGEKRNFKLPAGLGTF